MKLSTYGLLCYKNFPKNVDNEHKLITTKLSIFYDCVNHTTTAEVKDISMETQYKSAAVNACIHLPFHV